MKGGADGLLMPFMACPSRRRLPESNRRKRLCRRPPFGAGADTLDCLRESRRHLFRKTQQFLSKESESSLLTGDLQAGRERAIGTRKARIAISTRRSKPRPRAPSLADAIAIETRSGAQGTAILPAMERILALAISVIATRVDLARRQRRLHNEKGGASMTRRHPRTRSWRSAGRRPSRRILRPLNVRIPYCRCRLFPGHQDEAVAAVLSTKMPLPIRLSVALLSACAVLLATGSPSPAQGAFGLVSTQTGPGGIAIDVDNAGHIIGLRPTGIGSPQIAIFDQNGQRIGGSIPAADHARSRGHRRWRDLARGHRTEQASTVQPAGTLSARSAARARPTVAISGPDGRRRRTQQTTSAWPTRVITGPEAFSDWSGSCDMGERRCGTEGQSHGPAGIATSPTGEVYVADAGTGRIQEFTAGGVFVRAFGEFEAVPPETLATYGTWPLATTVDGSIYVRYLISRTAGADPLLTDRRGARILRLLLR